MIIERWLRMLLREQVQLLWTKTICLSGMPQCTFFNFFLSPHILKTFFYYLLFKYLIWIRFGPEECIWEGAIFKLKLTFTSDYPSKPPKVSNFKKTWKNLILTSKVRFISTVFHPNVYADGSICLDIIQDKWSPIYNVVTILVSIRVSLSRSRFKKFYYWNLITLVITRRSEHYLPCKSYCCSTNSRQS